MSLYLLLSTDTQLQTELEILLESASPAIPLVRAANREELSVYEASLQDIDAVLVDTDTFDPPDTCGLPLVLLGTPDNRNPPVPCLPKPLPADTPARLQSMLPDITPGASANPARLPDPALMVRLLRELVHDINNQLTTLRGNLPLINPPDPEDRAAVSDMIHATDHAGQLVHAIEAWFPDCRPEPRMFLLGELTDPVTRLSGKMFSCGLENAVTDAQSLIQLSGDPALLSTCLLQCLPLLGADRFPVRLQTGQENTRELELLLIPGDPGLPSESLPPLIQQWLRSCPPALFHCRLDHGQLVFRLPKRLAL